MRFVSTNSGSAPVELPEAIDCCLAADGGMYLPEVIPVVPRAFFNNIGEMSLREIAYVIASTFFGQDVPAAELKAMVDESFSFDAPWLRSATSMCLNSSMVPRSHSRITERVSWPG